MKNGAGCGETCFFHKRMDSGEHLIEDQAKGEDIRALVQLFALQLLRRHISRGAGSDAFFGKPRHKIGRLSRDFGAPTGLARPKSMTLACPFSISMMLAGLISL